MLELQVLKSCGARGGLPHISVAVAARPLPIETFKWVPPLWLYMERDKYTITFTGPEGATDIVADTHDEAMSIVSNLTKASNGYHSVKIEPPIQ